eukprot:TRINITY_DN54294_c0_g1_i1.p1 TRINITY_DN54294_c0_g1~~TRINITY_DN54294_c0_g1_i1.p1  ORF type:complete len:753 (+),score=229.18 TRINITY_DN54294_c0_g1_i1:58-2316(+)
MKAALSLAILAGNAHGIAEDGAAGDKTITKVVKLLQSLLDKSKTDGDAERDVYAKFKCYCDDNKVEKTTSVKELTTSIGLLGSKIEELQGSSGSLSSEAARLQADIAANEQARTEAQSVRDKAKAAFDAEEADLTAAITQLGQAVDTLAAIGSDQTMQSAADHAGFMANYPKAASLAKLGSSVKQALLASRSFLTSSQQQKIESFLETATNAQAPFTGFYASQAGEIVGILKSMKETFSSNLEAARTAEQKAVTAHAEFIKTKEDEHGVMTKEYDSKQSQLSQNDGDLATKVDQLEQAKTSKTDAEDFLGKLETMCEAKAKDYEQRTALRANEEAAISQAIAILNSDAAFSSFSKVAATSTGAIGFLQLKTVRRHVAAASGSTPGMLATRLLQDCSPTCPAKVRRVAALLQAGNPFESVLAAITKMTKLIDDEAKVDQTQFDWCDDERKTNGDNLQTKSDAIDALNGGISDLTTTIDDPVTGLKKQIEDTETSIDDNMKNQKDETADRRVENKAYTKNIADIVEAESLLTTAISVLKKYYDTFSLSQRGKQGGSKEEPAPPATWDEAYTGQSGKGKDAISMLEFILGESKKEEKAAHDAESAAQQSYEDSMQALKDSAEGLATSLVDLKKTLAEKELELERKREDLDVTTREKVAIERYLEQIKPGCDFITANLADRNAKRADEKSALERAEALLKDTPAYKAAVAAAKVAAQGDCKDLCAGDKEEHAQCKACLAGVSVPGYCAGHKGTVGC